MVRRILPFGLAAAAAAVFLTGSTVVLAGVSADAAAANWEASVTHKLGLDGRQAAALHAYDEQILSERAATAPALDEDQFRAMSLTQRLDWISQHAASDSERLRARAEAAHRFYATLSVEQQRQFDELTMPQKRETPAPSAAEDEGPPSPPNYSMPSHTDPVWLSKPGDVLARLYPSAALAQRLLGKVLLHCTVDVSGYLFDCTVESETPAHVGFGNAALEATGYMKMRPATQYGVPVPSPINIPLTFEPH